MRQVLRDMSPYATSKPAETLEHDVVVEQITKVITALDFEVDHDVGQSSFRCDIAVKKAGDTRYRLGILVDTLEHYAQTDLVEREMMKPKLLEAFGWSILRITAKDWHQQRAELIAHIRELLGE